VSLSCLAGGCALPTSRIAAQNPNHPFQPLLFSHHLVCCSTSFADRISLRKLATFYLWGQNLGVSFRLIHVKTLSVAVADTRLMETETAKESSLGDLSSALSIAMIARSPSSSYRDRRPSLIYCSHPVKLCQPTGLWRSPWTPLSTVYDSMHTWCPAPTSHEWTFCPRPSRSLASSKSACSLTIRGSARTRAYLAPRRPCPCPDLYIYASRPYELTNSSPFMIHTLLQPRRLSIDQMKLLGFI